MNRRTFLKSLGLASGSLFFTVFAPATCPGAGGSSQAIDHLLHPTRDVA